MTVTSEIEIAWTEVAELLGNPAVAIIDVLPVMSWREGHIPGTRSMPLPDLEARTRELLPNLHQRIVVYCAGYT